MKVELKDIINRMEPDKALSAMVEVIKELLPLLDESVRVDFVIKLLGETGSDKVASLVDL